LFEVQQKAMVQIADHPSTNNEGYNNQGLATRIDNESGYAQTDLENLYL